MQLELQKASDVLLFYFEGFCWPAMCYFLFWRILLLNWTKTSVEKDWMPNRVWAIMWANDSQVIDEDMRHPGSMW